MPPRALWSKRAFPAGRAALLAKILEFATQLLIVIALPRLLGPAEFGRLAIALAVVMLASVAISLGSPSAFARFLPAAPESLRAGLARTMTLRLLRVRVGQLVLVGAVLALVALGAPAHLAFTEAALVFAAIALEVAAVMSAQVALGLGTTWVWSSRAVVCNGSLLLAVPILFRHVGPRGVLQGVVLASAAGVVFAGWKVVGLLRGAEREVEMPAGAERYGRVVGMALFLLLLTYRGPVLAASALGLSAVETGFAGLAGSLALALMLAVHQVFTVSLPELVGHWERDPLLAERRLRRLGWWAEAALVPCAFAGTLALGPFLPLVAGERFAPAGSALVPVLALLPLLPLPLLAWQGAALRLRPEVALAVNATGAVALAVGALFLVPALGAPGASAALLVAVVAATLLGAWKLPRAVPGLLLLTAAAGTIGVLALALTLGLLR